MIELLVPILAFFSVMALGAGLVIAVSMRRRNIHARLSSEQGPHERAHALDTRTTAAVRVAGTVGKAFSLGTISAQLKENMTRAGYYRESAAAAFLGAKCLLLLLGILAVVLLAVLADVSVIIKMYASIMILGILFFAPNFVIRIQRKKRMGKIRNFLPDAVDLLEVCVSSGMGLDMAWNAVTDEIRRVSRDLGDEMSLVNLEIQLGATRAEAMRSMAKRTGADAISALVAMIVQSERFGTSVSEALRAFATSMRESRSLQAEEEAEKMAIKLLFPLVFFIFPVMLIVMVGPAGITLYEVMGPG